jgi:hypothetical protein
MKIFPKAFFLSILLGAVGSFAQQIPLVLGGILETGYGVLDDDSHGAGLTRITPFMGIWIQGWGYFRLGYGLYDFKETAESGDQVSVESRAFTTQIGISLGGVGKPYLVGSFTRVKHLSNIGDDTWNEWGAGLGATFQLNSMSAIVSEMEYRWIRKHYNPIEEISVSGTRLQLNLGFVVYVY